MYVMMANHAEVSKNGRLLLAGADFNVIYVPHVPVTAPGFFVVTKTVFDAKEVGQHLRYQLRILDTDGNPLPQPQIDEDIVVQERDDPDLPCSVSLMGFVQPSEFQRLGVYRLTVRIGDQQRSVPFKVAQGPAPAPQ